MVGKNPTAVVLQAHPVISLYHLIELEVKMLRNVVTRTPF